MHFAARIGADARNRILELASDWNVSLSDAVRIVTVIGLGGSWDDGMAACAKAAQSRRDLEAVVSERTGRPLTVREPKSVFVEADSAQIVNVNIGAPWSLALKQGERGAAKMAILAGLSRL